MKKICLLVFFILCLPQKSRAAQDPFQAGAAAATLPLPSHISLAGYTQRLTFPWNESPSAFFFKASKGIHDPIRAKAVVFLYPNQKVAIVSVDLVAIPPQMPEALAKRLADINISADNLFIAATHTHSGPGDFVESWLWEHLAVDKYRPDIFESFVDSIEKVIRQANGKLAPAVMNSTSSQILGVTFNRRKDANLDPTLTLLTVNDLNQNPVATLINFPIHGTVMGPQNLEISADVPGAIERYVELHGGGTALFLNGAEGDVAPLAKTPTFEGVEELANRVGDTIMTLRGNGKSPVSPQIKIVNAEINLGKPSFNIKACTHVTKINSYQREAMFSKSLPTTAKMSAILLGHLLFFTIPGEIVTSIGKELKTIGEQNGFATTSILGLTNGYVGYILPPEDFARGGYEACASFYGLHLSSAISDTAQKLIKDLR